MMVKVMVMVLHTHAHTRTKTHTPWVSAFTHRDVFPLY
jgi:hypothetical protein